MKTHRVTFRERFTGFADILPIRPLALALVLGAIISAPVLVGFIATFGIVDVGFCALMVAGLGGMFVADGAKTNLGASAGFVWPVTIIGLLTYLLLATLYATCMPAPYRNMLYACHKKDHVFDRGRHFAKTVFKHPRITKAIHKEALDTQTKIKTLDTVLAESDMDQKERDLVIKAQAELKETYSSLVQELNNVFAQKEITRDNKAQKKAHKERDREDLAKQMRKQLAIDLALDVVSKTAAEDELNQTLVQH